MTSKRFELAKSIILILVSTTMYSIGLHCFVNPSNLYPSGFLGVSKVVTSLLEMAFGWNINFMFLYFFLQLFATYLVYRYVGHRFALLTVFQFTIVTLLGLFVPDYPIVQDTFLMVLFGGALCGIGIIFALKAGSSFGGTDFMVIYSQNRDPSVPIWDYVMYFNWFIIMIAGFVSGAEIALYSIIYQFVTTMVVSNMDSRHKLAGLYIITERADDVSEALFANLHRGITKIWGEGAYTRQPKTLLFMVVNSFEVNQTIKIITSVDEKAFINVTKSEKVIGNFVRKKFE